MCLLINYANYKGTLIIPSLRYVGGNRQMLKGIRPPLFLGLKPRWPQYSWVVIDTTAFVPWESPGKGVKFPDCTVQSADCHTFPV